MWAPKVSCLLPPSVSFLSGSASVFSCTFSSQSAPGLRGPLWSSRAVCLLLPGPSNSSTWASPPSLSSSLTQKGRGSPGLRSLLCVWSHPQAVPWGPRAPSACFPPPGTSVFQHLNLCFIYFAQFSSCLRQEGKSGSCYSLWGRSQSLIN